MKTLYGEKQEFELIIGNKNIINMNEREVHKEDTVFYEYDTASFPVDTPRGQKIALCIRSVYSVDDEYKMINLGIQNKDDKEYISYRTFVQSVKDQIK